MCSKAKITGIIITIIFLLAINPLDAAWWEMKGLPVPAHTEKIKDKNTKFEGAEFDVVYYTSTLNTQSIRDFYEKKLIKLGWQKSDPFAQLGNIPDIKVTPELTGLFGDALIFRKDNETIVIRFLSQGVKETKYILTKNKLFLEKTVPIDIASLPRPTFKLKHNNIPEYPDAELINLSEEQDYFGATYLSREDPLTVTKFYKNRLLSNNWNLIREHSPTKIYPPKQPNYYKGLQLGVLEFSKANGESCRICVAHPILDESKITNQSSITYITISYEKNS